MKKLVKLLLTLGGFFLLGGLPFTVEAREEDHLIRSESWYQDYNQGFQDWASQMGQSYVRYFPGDTDAFRHSGLSLDDILDQVQINQQPVKMALANQVVEDTDYIIDAIYSTYHSDQTVDRLITYFIVEDPAGNLQTLVSEQTDTSYPIQFKPTANSDLSALVYNVSDEGAPASNDTILGIANALKDGGEASDTDSAYQARDDLHKQISLLLKKYFPEDEYGIFLGQGLVAPKGGFLILDVTIDGKPYLMSQGEENDCDFEFIYSIMNQAEGREDKDFVILYNRHTDQYILAYHVGEPVEDKYETWDDPQLIQELDDLLKGKIQISEEPSSDNRLADLFMNRDQSFSLEECEKYLRIDYGDLLPNESPLVIDRHYKWKYNEGMNSIIIQQSSPGLYYVLQSMEGPVFSAGYFCSGGNIIAVYWHRGPTGTAKLVDRESLEEIEVFEFNGDQHQEYLDLIR